MAIDWVAISASVAEIRPKVKDILDFVTEQAGDADEKIGAQIAEYLANVIPEALQILAEANKEIEAKSLTLENAKIHMTKLKVLVTEKVKEHLKPTVAQLPAPVADKIRAKLDESLAAVGKIAHHIFELLQ